ncbi:hypothetical protein KAX08_09850 [candidate division WOR-3 bacterium]|nr:hypothetical protein [candidate division WOR-3 bacterium]
MIIKKITTEIQRTQRKNTEIKGLNKVKEEFKILIYPNNEMIKIVLKGIF